MVSEDVDRKDIPEEWQFQANLTSHPIIRDEKGVLRYRANPLICWLQERVNFNDIRFAYHMGAWSREEYMQFYRDLGFSLQGFQEVWAEELEKMESEQ